MVSDRYIEPLKPPNDKAPNTVPQPANIYLRVLSAFTVIQDVPSHSSVFLRAPPLKPPNAKALAEVPQPAKRALAVVNLFTATQEVPSHSSVVE